MDTLDERALRISSIIAISLLIGAFIGGWFVGRSRRVGANIGDFGPHARILKSKSIRKEVKRATTVTCNKIIARELKEEATMAEQEARNVEEGKDAKNPNRRGVRKSTTYSVQ